MVFGQVLLWVGNTTPGPKALTVPVTILITSSVAVRRRHPLAVGSFVSVGFTALLLSANPQTNVAIAIAVFCGWYALAVWTDTRGSWSAVASWPR